MDRKCVLDWLNEVFVTPSLSYSEYTDEEIRIFAHDALVLLKEQEADKNKYEYKYDHTDCLWYGSGNCPSTCSQYRDGWNDAMDYIFKDGKGYQPYRRSVKLDDNA